jgi:hypothetical protein
MPALSVSIQSEARLDTRVLLCCWATGSQKMYRLRRFFALLGSISQYAQGKSNSGNFGITLCCAVCHHSGKLGNFCQPASVFFLFKLNSERF